MSRLPDPPDMTPPDDDEELSNYLRRRGFPDEEPDDWFHHEPHPDLAAEFGGVTPPPEP